MATEMSRFLDIGGGPEGDKSQEVMSNLRAVQLARQNSKGEYIVFDLNLPRQLAKDLSRDIPNLHFIQGRLALDRKLPFKDYSMDRVEMNFMYTPLTYPWGRPQWPYEVPYDQLFGTPHNPRLYIHALKEACRLLKPGGVLAITEKQQRLDWIRRLLSKDSWLDLDGYLMSELGLKNDWVGIQAPYDIQEIIDPTRTLFTGIAIKQGEYAREIGDTKEANNVRVFCMELHKKDF